MSQHKDMPRSPCPPLFQMHVALTNVNAFSDIWENCPGHFDCTWQLKAVSGRDCFANAHLGVYVRMGMLAREAFQK